MKNTDLNELFFGSDASDKINRLNEGLLLIEKQHLGYFKNRLIDSNEDRLHNHYIIITNSHGISINFLHDSDLDQNIKSSCIDLFNSIFNPEIKK